MADKGKKGKGGGSGQKKGGAEKASAEKAPVEKTEKAPVEKAEKAEKVAKAEKAVEAKAAAHDDHDDHAPDHGHGAHGAHGGHQVNRREYWVVFAVLFVLTGLEVGIAQIKSIPHGMVVLGLVGLALSKAAIVAMFYMHLKHETKFLKLTVFLPFLASATYALALMGDSAWRMIRW